MANGEWRMATLEGGSGQLHAAGMILSTAELEALVAVRHASPHDLLGMHPLGVGKGVVIRAVMPGATGVEAHPVHESAMPRIRLEMVHPGGVFEGVSPRADRVFAYDLVVTWSDGRQTRARDPYSFLPTMGETDMFLFGQGNERRIYDKLGAQLRTIDGVAGTSFAVWAPSAQRVSVVGDFNQWDGRRHMMRRLGASGVWEIYLADVGEGALYKYEIRDAHGNVVLKTDPYGFFFELAPKNASIVWNTRKFGWTDGGWLTARSGAHPLAGPMAVYEMHLGSWRKRTISESLGYREVAGPLIDYIRRVGFTHVEFMPVSEHAFYPSWGYQVTGFYSPTCRYGTPDDFQYLVNALHDAGIGVLIDWVPAHFPRDEWALARFDGTSLYEHEDPRRGAHMDWGTLIFNYGRHEVRNFLTANALFWCDRYHVDGLRVDAVASMLYLDYSKKPGEWLPNRYGGRENLEAIEFLREFNHLVHTENPGVATIAEESTAWGMVSRPPYVGGLGFSMKWNMGWMHDTLGYFKREPIHRQYHHNELTFAMLYHYNENFVLPLSHDEVVYGKGSLLGRMPGDPWQRFSNLRCLLAYQWLFPGKKLLFMGGEFGQVREWNHNAELDWWLLQEGHYHAGCLRLVEDLNRLYRSHPALWEADFQTSGFRWVDCSDHAQSVLSFLRLRADGSDPMLVILNLTPVPRIRYRLGVPKPGNWIEVLNTDAALYGGSNQGNMGGVEAEERPLHGLPCSATFSLPPLSVIVFESPAGRAEA
jgi:1,4-alpha-glucan branching enzyme